MTPSSLVTGAVDELKGRARQEIDDGLLPSCQLALAIDGEVAEVVTYGDVPHGDGTRYLVYSATKAIVSAAVLQLLGEGSLHLSDRIADHIPEFATNGKDAVTVEQVMTYTSGFARAPMGPSSWSTREGRFERFARWRLDGELGRYDYHITSGHGVQAGLLEAVDGVDYRESVRRRIAEPLGLSQLRLGVPAAEQGDVARPVPCGEPATAEEFEAALGISGIDAGEANDENLVALGRPELIELGLPGGGAVSDAADMARLYQALLHNPDTLWNPAVLADATATVRITALDTIRGVPANRTIAFMVAGTDGCSAGRGMGHGAGPRTFGHDGIGGQLAFADPATGLSFCYLTNGIDRNILRQQRRARSIATRANKCGS